MGESVVQPIRSILAVVGLGLAVMACAAKPESKDDLLADSGFKVVPVKTPGQLASFKKLPAHQLTRRSWQGKRVWLYADPTICGCLYAGTQANYDTYIKKASAQMIDEAMKANYADSPYSPTGMDAQIDSDWEWGEWGNPGMWGLPY
jgi:hypothetical protein